MTSGHAQHVLARFKVPVTTPSHQSAENTLAPGPIFQDPLIDGIAPTIHSQGYHCRSARYYAQSKELAMVA